MDAFTGFIIGSMLLAGYGVIIGQASRNLALRHSTRIVGLESTLLDHVRMAEAQGKELEELRKEVDTLRRQELLANLMELHKEVDTLRHRVAGRLATWDESERQLIGRMVAVEERLTEQARHAIAQGNRLDEELARIQEGLSTAHGDIAEVVAARWSGMRQGFHAGAEALQKEDNEPVVTPANLLGPYQPFPSAPMAPDVAAQLDAVRGIDRERHEELRSIALQLPASPDYLHTWPYKDGLYSVVASDMDALVAWFKRYEALRARARKAAQ